MCIDAEGRTNSAALGEACQGLGILVEYCDVTNTLPAGVCDDISGTCLPLCGPDPNGCLEDESCYTIAGGGPGDGWGFCVAAEGGWMCDPDSYDDGGLCDCGCGAPDPHCEDPALGGLGCPEGDRCVEDSCVSP